MKIVIVILFVLFSVCAKASEVSVASIINLEKKLNILKSEIFIAGNNSQEINESFSLYYIKNKSWLKSLKSISPNDIDTSAEYKNYNNILYGISLQGVENKKQALKFYKKVPRSSIYYATAQLNISLLYFYDGYINKALVKLNKLLSDSSVNLNYRIKNKILLVLGYLYLKNNKFNESRVIFRKIPVGSIYFNRAIIGVALAANQINDYSASENVLLFLQKNMIYDLAVDESYILLAYTYETQMEFSKAAIAYEKAISHYSKRVKNINELLYESSQLNMDEVINKHIFVVSSNQIDLLEMLPHRFFDNYSQSKQLLIKISGLVDKESKMHKRASGLVSDYRKIITPLLVDQLVIRKNILLDYINQSRYRLATSKDRSSAFR